MKNLILILIAAVVCFLYPAKSLACSCLLRARPSGIDEQKFKEQVIKEEFQTALAVFSGEVVSVNYKEAPANNNSTPYYEITFRLKRAWKGAAVREVKVYTPDNCFRYQVELGKSYLVYAGSSTGDNQLWTGNCAGNLPLESAADELKILGRIKKNKIR